MAGVVGGHTHRHSSGSGGPPTHFQVDHTFEVRGVGPVLSGTVVSGSVTLGQELLLGPDADGSFTAVEVTCIQRSQVGTYWECAGNHRRQCVCNVVLEAWLGAAVSCMQHNSRQPQAVIMLSMRWSASNVSGEKVLGCRLVQRIMLR